MNWANAENNCRSLNSNAHLLVVNDDAEMLAIGGIIGFFCSYFKNYFVRIGRIKFKSTS